MSRWPLIGSIEKLVVIALILGTCLLFSPAAADVSNVRLNITPEDICEDNNATVQFHVFSGLTGGVSGIYITFDENFTISDDITTDCVMITNSTGASGHPLDIYVIDNPDSEYASFGFPDGTTTLKMTVPVGIRQNSVVRLDFTCGVDIDCPCVCPGYYVWANTDLEQKIVQSNPWYMKVRIESAAGPNGSITPAGTTLFECCSDPSFLVEADPCYLIENISVMPLCDGCGDCYAVTFESPTTSYVINFTDVQCCYNITAYFTQKTCNVTAIAHENGRILSPDGIWSPPDHTKKFNCSEQGTFLIVPDISYSIENVTVNGEAAQLIFLENGSATLPFVSDCNDTVIEAYFKQSPVDAFLKYQLPKDQCGAIVEVQVKGMTEIGPMAEFADDLYLGGNSSSFDVNGTAGTHFGTFSAGAYGDDDTSAGEDLAIAVNSPPAANPETYRVSYTNGSGTFGATVTILPDMTVVWAPYLPTDVTDVLSVTALQPAWQMVTQDYLDHNPDWEGLVGLVIYVANGTYHETVEIDTPGVHLKAFEGAEPVIDANGGSVGSGDDASAVFLSAGCTGIEGFTITGSGANGITVHPSSPKCANATILDWISGDTTSVPCALGRVNIVNNTVTENEENGIRAIDCVVLILGNVIFGNDDDGIDAGCLLTGVECVDPEAITHDPASSEILYNEIYQNGEGEHGEWVVNGRFTSDPTACGDLPGWTDAGIQIRCTGLQNDGPDGTLYLVHNDLHDNYHAGIYLMDGATSGSSIAILGNHLTGNGVFGMLTEAEIPGLVDFRYNDITGNTFWGVKNLDEDDLVAKENYWGSPGGPSRGPAPIVQCIECRCHEEDQRSDALGNGDAVSHRIHYNPWLYVSAADIFHDGGNAQFLTRSYGSDSLLLQSGWNTLSVPCKLSGDADTIGEIAALGDFVTNGNTVVVYAWDAEHDLWIDIGASGTPLVPGQGYYIKMKSPSRFPVLYSNNPSPGLPSFELVEGWNLIGSPFGIDRTTGNSEEIADECETGLCTLDHSSETDQGRWGVASPDSDDPEAFMLVRQALESIKEGNGGTKGVAIIVSPSVPGQVNVYSSAVTTGFWEIANSREMATGEGYWVFMVNPATYAGFEITPFYLPDLI